MGHEHELILAQGVLYEVGELDRRILRNDCQSEWGSWEDSFWDNF